MLFTSELSKNSLTKNSYMSTWWQVRRVPPTAARAHHELGEKALLQLDLHQGEAHVGMERSGKDTTTLCMILYRNSKYLKMETLTIGHNETLDTENNVFE